MEALGINTAIVRVLKEYDKNLPIEFLAKKIGRETSETRSNIEELIEEGVVRLMRDNTVQIIK